MEPRIADRLTLIWIGGHEHADARPPPGGADLEYNTAIDPIAAQVVFNDSSLRLWQVPRDVYRMAMISRAELIDGLASAGRLGRHLFERLARVMGLIHRHGLTPGESFVLGDSPLVLLTALATVFEPDAASSPSRLVPCPRLLASGLYESRPDGRALRVFTGLDNRLMFADFFAKLRALARTES